MARTFSTNFQNALDSDNIRYFFLIEVDLPSGTDYYTSHSSDITWPTTNGNTYISDGGMFEVEPPKFSSVVDREAYKIVLTDINDSLADEFKTANGIVGNDIHVRVGLLNSNNQPLLADDDIVSIYKGFVDSPSITNSWETKLATIEGSSPMADLDQVNLFMVSRDGMDQKSTTDTSFDEIFGDREITLKWGKV